MQLTIIDDSTGNIIPVEVEDQETVENLKVLIEIELNRPVDRQILQYHGQTLENSRKLTDYKIQNHDLINLVVGAPPVSGNLLNDFMNAFQSIANNNPQSLLDQRVKMEAQRIKEHFTQNPNELQYIRHQNPQLHEAVMAPNNSVLETFVRANMEAKLKKEEAKMERLRRAQENPFDLELQKEIEEEIRMERVNENLEIAQEYFPENFGSITMLYIDVEVNKHPIQAFVDSGAQSTIMSQECAERCGLMKLLDRRFHGVAVGVGSGKILGRIHAADLRVAGQYLPCSFTVLEKSGVDMLFGLDNLKRHQCCIDLAKGCLTFNNGAISVPFLSEGTIKKSFIEDVHPHVEEQKEASPSQTQIKPQAVTSPSRPGNAPVTSAAQPRPQVAPANTSGFPEADIQTLTNLGFDRARAVEALKVCAGNVETAASYLFQSNF